MSDTIFFKCQHCGLPYVGKTAPRSKRHSGTIECVDCEKSAHEWAGFYSLFDWHPARTERGDDARYPQQPLNLGDKWEF
jgi:hypothetical protein